jgi:hypothetical protein
MDVGVTLTRTLTRCPVRRSEPRALPGRGPWRSARPTPRSSRLCPPRRSSEPRLTQAGRSSAAASPWNRRKCCDYVLRVIAIGEYASSDRDRRIPKMAVASVNRRRRGDSAARLTHGCGFNEVGSNDPGPAAGSCGSSGPPASFKTGMSEDPGVLCFHADAVNGHELERGRARLAPKRAGTLPNRNHSRRILLCRGSFVRVPRFTLQRQPRAAWLRAPQCFTRERSQVRNPPRPSSGALATADQFVGLRVAHVRAQHGLIRSE